MEHEQDQDVSLEQRFSEDLRTDRQSHPWRQKYKKGGKAKDFKAVSDSTLAPLILERDFLRNHSDAIKERRTVQVELENQRRARMQLHIQIKQLQTITDSMQSHIQVLRAERSQLESNRTTLEVSCGRCPVGWIFLKTSCYFYSNSPSNAKKNWPDSRADCTSRGGDLLVINNLEEQKAINNNYPKILGTGVQWKMGFWIGLTDRVTNGVWTWVNNATENDTMYWQSGQPNNEESLAGHCVAFGRNIQSWRSWYNRNCENDELNWICEMKPKVAMETTFM
uniref:C-type lectin domain-containing protein n=1 Tax=Neogobius melanostomus TaxID=47308 RepID=A0A8C6T1X5_9GOBI